MINVVGRKVKIMIDIIEINIKQLRDGKLIQLLDIAGFSVVMRDRSIELIDKKSEDACKYSDLVFSSLYDAVMAVEPYLKNNYRIVA